MPLDMSTQKPILRPLKQLTSDSYKVLDLVYDFYVVNKPVEEFDEQAHFTVVSDIFLSLIQNTESTTQFQYYDEIQKYKVQLPTNFKPRTDFLRRIGCQMMERRPHEYHKNAHHTTMDILKDLDGYPWSAKAVIALAAFALENGMFWHLLLVPEGDNLGKSLAVLNHTEAFKNNRKDISEYNQVVKKVFLTVYRISKLERIMKDHQEGKESTTLQSIMHEIPAYVYWAVLTIAICASHIKILLDYPSDGLGLIDREDELSKTKSNYKLSDIDLKIGELSMSLDDYLRQIEKERAESEEYYTRERLVFNSHSEIVQVLTCLLFPLREMNHYVTRVSGGKMTQVSLEEEFKQKHVLLFISGLESIDDEIRLLKSIHEGVLNKVPPKVVDDPNYDPREGKFISSEDFRILWAPIVDDSTIPDNITQLLFKEKKKGMDWYVVDYAIIPPICKKLIRNRLDYQNNPIVPVIHPQHSIVNEDALHMLFSWGGDAFPWHRYADLKLNDNFNWFWNEVQKSKPDIRRWVNEKNEKKNQEHSNESYIIIYGRTDADFCDDQWLMKIPEAIERIRKDEITKKGDIVIHDYHYGKGDKERQTVARFWAYVESTFDSMRRKTSEEKKKTTMDEEPSFKHVKTFLGLRQVHFGWVILSKGPNIKRFCRGDAFVETLVNFDSWKENILKDSGFDVSFENYYDKVMSKLPLQCYSMELKDHLSNVYDPIFCPLCGHKMDLEYAGFTCCHGYKQVDVQIIGEDGRGTYLSL